MKIKINDEFYDLSNYYPLLFTVIFIVILFQYSFSSIEAIFYDMRIKYDLVSTQQDNIVVIYMDEDSDEYLGEKYPYTYASHARMIKRLNQDKPAIINYISTLNEPESDTDIENLNYFETAIEDFTSHGGMFRFGSEMDAWGELKPPRDLQNIGYSLALINIDNFFAKDDVARRAILNISGESTLHVWTASQYRKLHGGQAIDVNNLFGAYYVREADAFFAMFPYFSNPSDGKHNIKEIPFHRVLVGNFPEKTFKDKIVLIAPKYLSNPSNYVLTPFDKDELKAPKAIVHAQIIEALIQNKTILAVPRWVSYVLALVLGLFLSLVISRVKPTTGLLVTFMTIAGVFIIGHLLFSLFGLWIYLTHLILTIFVVYYIWVPFRAIAEYQTRFAIQEETKILKKVESLKQNFISLMSHDLKTPVAKIAGMADVLIQKNRGTPELVNGLHSIINSTKDLNKYITSILDLTKIESQNLTLNKGNKDINQLIETVTNGLKFEASAKQIAVILDLSPLYPIEIDPNLMVRVFHNLVENAIKYSGEGTQITIKTWDDAQWVYVKISDNGRGIPPEDLGYIFDKFYRVKNESTHSIKGTGLGLYLVKYFVELHGGQISVQSTLGKGTSFEIKLKNA
ncbi:MAG: CHASE2 domain-containing protein [Bdellovibrio sp.]|nr:CHASE2 domain-containing protein [Bdellovibrio sp.]